MLHWRRRYAGFLARWRVGDHQALIVAGVHMDGCGLLMASVWARLRSLWRQGWMVPCCCLHSLLLLLLGFGLGSTQESMAPRVDGLVLAMEGGTLVVAHSLHSLHIHSLDIQSLHTHRNSLSSCFSSCLVLAYWVSSYSPSPSSLLLPRGAYLPPHCAGNLSSEHRIERSHVGTMRLRCRASSPPSMLIPSTISSG